MTYLERPPLNNILSLVEKAHAVPNDKKNSYFFDITNSNLIFYPKHITVELMFKDRNEESRNRFQDFGPNILKDENTK